MKRQNNKKRKILLLCTLTIILMTLITEIGLRQYGFLQSPLYKDDEKSNYILVENQDVNRFGNKFITNEYSMRNLPLKLNETRILVLGDSVINGGVQTDHNFLATTLLENQLTKDFNSSIRVLNSSAGGWGIDNCMGVVKNNGDFNSKILVLALNSHDAVGTISKDKIAGINKSFPKEQYPLAILELFDRYLIPAVKSKLGINNDTSTNTSVGDDYSEGWKYFSNYCKERNIPLVIYLHAEKSEYINKEYNSNGKWIINFAKENNIELIQDLGFVNETDYRDTIHFTESGQKVIYNLLYSNLKEKLNGYLNIK